MGKEEEIEAERKPYESDDIWLTRKAFLLQHWGSMPRDQLQCLSQLFINVNMIGCEYSPSIMEKVGLLGAGIMDKAQRLQDENQYVKASQGRQKAEEYRQKQQDQRDTIKAERKGPTVDEKLRQLKVHMKQAIAASPLNLLNMAGRVQLPWRLDCVNGDTELRIKHYIAFRHKFHHTKDSESIAISCVVDGFLNCEPSVSGESIVFDNAPPTDCYKKALIRKLEKARHHLGSSSNFKGLQDALEKVELHMLQNATHLQGWSQQMDLRVDDLLLISKVLTKNECVKNKLAAAVDDMCSSVCEALRRGPIDIEDTGSGLRLIL